MGNEVAGGAQDYSVTGVYGAVVSGYELDVGECVVPRVRTGPEVGHDRFFKFKFCLDFG
jgi:hypothetical protein